MAQIVVGICGLAVHLSEKVNDHLGMHCSGGPKSSDVEGNHKGFKGSGDCRPTATWCGVGEHADRPATSRHNQELTRKA